MAECSDAAIAPPSDLACPMHEWKPCTGTSLWSMFGT
eukprot:CAMPEP_0206280062 /NCGR_PEP_ID=MMETSP0047_2-20121206/38357_1 /ASSEMBLY_ACC=CAM_ASM_000192 /TAXON_ID=195065 /ORGANISM="Chroomonas mesostigmatica_cf, Strain CCMP1168" /LENGTH=36 /DNA_ID= /DNA_START= /DNA_END= /DNA_ORIENTATION=